MKRNLVKATGAILCLLLSLSVYAQNKNVNAAKYAGDWTFTVSEAPYGYESGKATIQYVNGSLSGEFTLNGSKMKVDSFKESEDYFSGVVYVDGYPVNVKLYYKDNQITGTADTDGMIFPLTFKKVN